MLKKLLIANRGEIAIRIIRACHELGIESVAVYSEADRLSPHVLMADEAYPIGPAPSAESYLRIDKLIEVAERTGCDAIHPGYGFLAENADFAAAVEGAGLIFVGPSPSAIEAMGDKTEARRRMIDAGVPVVPGTAEPLADLDAAYSEAERIGYPVLIKAAAGGGGRGMREVLTPEDLPRAFEAATSEATTAFGDGRVYLERYLVGPRHIEIQVLADAHGNIIHLGERECSIQRRHQKMIEEAPSPVLTPELREEMGEAAVAAARAVEYRNAGTVEFLFQDGDFYFLEMNTRIQVEHPVTEMVTGVDLVEWQLRIASGQTLDLEQDDITITGHAIECRITSEDPRQNFLPSTGRIEYLQLPGGPGVRWDGGIAEGFEISLFYDPMIGKLIVHAPDRAAAIERMRRALNELKIIGVETSRPFHEAVMQEPDFRAARVDIGYLAKHPDLLEVPVPEAELRLTALTAALLEEEARERRRVQRIEPVVSQSGRGGWRERGW